jgi:2-polyprenyl-6-methoxyphenol hydroxylase-like FAD-dependent oxidoreductase
MDCYGVIVIGYGPTGRVLALKPAQRGRRVLVLERQRESYPLPRAAHFDDEVGRMLQGAGLPPCSIPEAIEPYDDFYELRNTDRELLLRLDWRGHGTSGWNVSNFFHQPTLENRLHEEIEATGNVTVRRGHRAVDRSELSDAVEVVVRAEGDAAPYRVRARYVIGADGANSLVRDWTGTDVEDMGYFRDWLVVDVEPSGPFTLEPPMLQVCDPQRPTSLVPSGPGRSRWEFMRLETEQSDQFASLDNAWRLLAPWNVTPDNATLVRHALYTFQARRAHSWRQGRMLLAGDAVHQMPPVAGQGMCSGLRDAPNLAWKLDLVLGGTDDALLDTYGTERSDHVAAFIGFSMELGRPICASDPEEVHERDERMKAELASGAARPHVRFPASVPGCTSARVPPGSSPPPGHRAVRIRRVPPGRPARLAGSPHRRRGDTRRAGRRAPGAGLHCGTSASVPSRSTSAQGPTQWST